MEASQNSQAAVQQCSSFIKARTSIGHLELTDNTNESEQDQKSSEMQASRGAYMRNTPLACSSLEVQCFFADVLHYYTDQAAQLTKLTIASDTPLSRDVSLSNFSSHFHSFQHLTQLKDLAIFDESDCSLTGVLAHLPRSIESLTLTHTQSITADHPSLSHQLSADFTALQRLDLRDALIDLPGESITFFDRLTSLSLNSACIVVDDPQALEALTNLVALDLSYSNWWPTDDAAWPHPDPEFEPCTLFTGWPALSVLNVQGCDVFDKNTVWDLLPMKELHIDLLLGDAPAENIHLRLWHRHVTLADVLNIVKDFAWFSRIVSLEFDLEVITTEDLNSTFRQLAASCHKLDSLRIKLLTRQANLNWMYLIGDEAHGSRLRSLELWWSADTKQRVCCGIVDLSCASALTYLRLLGIDHPDTFSLHLPSSLQSLSFSGRGLFTQGNQAILQGLNCLTDLYVCPAVVEEQLFKSFCDIPVLPSSLCKLTLVCPPNTAMSRDSDWHCLSACPCISAWWVSALGALASLGEKAARSTDCACLPVRQLGHNRISISFKCLQVMCHLHQAVMYRRLRRAVHPWEPASEF